MGLGVLGLHRTISLGWVSGYSLAALSFGAITIGAKLRKKGMRLGQPDARRRLEMDDRAPIVLLRPFGLDNTEVELPGFMKHVMFTTAWYLSNAGFTFEQALATEFQSRGPLVAVGKPGEPIQPLGFARLYVNTKGGWQAAVHKLMNDAQRIIAVVGIGEGIRWELSQALESEQLREKTILISPPTESGQRSRWTTVQRHLPHLPAIPPDTFAVLFKKGGEISIVAGPTTRSTWAAKVSGLSNS